ncbi:MAG TPA: hypothetical protein VL981_07645 [Candidatus Methylacidiphilales bacterium]|nr:hypothetical protein [Candidatus Methylacidiphilales bacterium]
MTDGKLLRQFEAKTLPFDQWTHRCHVKVAYLYLKKCPFAEALRRMRRGIKAYNNFHRVPENPVSGYNETTTHAFMHLIASIMRAYGSTFPSKTADEFCDNHPQLLSRHALRFFYSPRHRMHPLAKTEFLKPDLAPLPRIMTAKSQALTKRKISKA